MKKKIHQKINKKKSIQYVRKKINQSKKKSNSKRFDKSTENVKTAQKEKKILIKFE